MVKGVTEAFILDFFHCGSNKDKVGTREYKLKDADIK
jgi:hypothetical protein